MGKPTDELRARLDELGVEWKSEIDCDTYWYGQDRTFYKFTEYNDGSTSFSTCQWNLTPKQALTAPIAATVVAGTCKNVGESTFVCSKCGAHVKVTNVGRSYVDENGKRWYSTSSEHKFRHCPNCGRRIEEESE